MSTPNINTQDSLYRHVAITGTSLASVLRGAADWLDAAEQGLGDVLFVKATHFELMEDQDEPWEFSLFVYEDEFQEAHD